ncbi:SPOR domain-containing protein [Sphingosinicella sp. LHD-64]|uniref:SPOR domain-containing protein n=1 Tax=Sphingosinicella sp. LHD-64 TaxID=3072139 RepID=UPI00280C505D|nr:SPOR domain-containing protein [Sphingosinicella sp. LHD-64]MDQ8755270.1 SPOR domain-containing protein [Sphingosinicella sp. LHD-64]
MNKTAFKIAASTIIVSLTMAAGSTQSGAMRRGSGQAAAPANVQAAQLHEQAIRAAGQGNLAEALGAMEQAVALAPRDAGYRLALADVYLKSGRFESARATFADVIELDPANIRAGMSFALTQIALGQNAVALGQLAELEGRASGADLGLAYALAGSTDRAIELLEPLARSQSATARVRQNLALSYALSGDWRRARAIAAQDISPAALPNRMTQWAAMARPDAGPTRLASLLGVTPVQDPGQPVRLALSQPAPTPIQVAEAVPAPAQVEAAPAPVAYTAAAETVSDWGLPAPEAAPAPVEVAAAEAPTYYTPAPQAPIEAPSEAEVQYVLAAQALNQPAPAVVRTAAASLPPAPVFRRAAPRPASAPAVRTGTSRYVVQLGAFSNEANAERAWVETQRRFGLTPYAPLTATIDHEGRTLHRVAVAGFASQSDAQRLCGAIRARGGACFVRGNAGDASIRWAARYANGRTRNV